MADIPNLSGQEALALRRRKLLDDFLFWVEAARGLLADHFPAERKESHNSLVIETATSLMLMHKLGEIEYSLDEICNAIEMNGNQ